MLTVAVHFSLMWPKPAHLMHHGLRAGPVFVVLCAQVQQRLGSKLFHFCIDLTIVYREQDCLLPRVVVVHGGVKDVSDRGRSMVVARVGFLGADQSPITFLT
ncbi:unnamed protein product [Pylaiella littoralis]